MERVQKDKGRERVKERADAGPLEKANVLTKEKDGTMSIEIEMGRKKDSRVNNSLLEQPLNSKEKNK